MPHLKLLVVLACAAMMAPEGRAQIVSINELMAANATTLADEYGEFSDWLELYNDSAESVDLTGFGLSDDRTDLRKWIVPTLTLVPGEFRVIYASGRDTAGFGGSWDAVVTQGDLWRYRIGAEEPPPSWTDPGFNDSAWADGRTGIGYGDGDDATVISAARSIYARIRFSVDDPSSVHRALFHMDYDDGFVAYLNGTEIARANLGEPGVRPPHDELAQTVTEPRSVLGLAPEMFGVEGPASILVAGENVLAVQVHNASTGSSDLTCIPYLTLGLTDAAAPREPAAEISRFFRHEMHAGFRLSADGEDLFLSDRDGVIVDSVRFGPIPGDVSLGRQPDGEGPWHYFDRATPGASNTTPAYTQIAEPPVFSQIGGRYASPLTLSLSATPGTQVFYTTSGATPNEQSVPYGAPISVRQTSVVRARAFQAGSLPSRVVTHTYVVGENTTLPVVSISTDPPLLWDRETGIYAFPSEDYDMCPSFPHFCANFWEDREIEVNLEIFEGDGTADLNVGAGITIVGGWSRGFAQKSLGVFARGRYGSPEFGIRLFPDRPYGTYQSFLLRNSGNDWDSTMLRDGFLQKIVDETDADRMEYRPSVLYLNGQYWGIHNLREKINEHYAAALGDMGPDDVDLIGLDTDQLAGDPEIVGGDAEHYEQLMAFVSSANMSTAEALQTIRGMMDVENFIDYQVTQIYIGNTDWPGNNVKLWRPRTPDGRWRWILFDLDFGFGRWNPQDFTHNTLAFAAEPSGPDWPNPPWSTLLFRRLLLNPGFRIDFVNRYADFLNSYFREDHVLSVLDSVQALIDHEIPDHTGRWGRTYTSWQSEVNNLRYYARNRPSAAESHLRSFFGLGSAVSITVEASGGGTVRVNRLRVTDFPWTGDYYPGVPVRISAEPDAGFRFAGWEDAAQGTDRTIQVNPLRPLTVRAVFEPATAKDLRIVINEIQYHPPDDMPSEDWVEIVNREAEAIDLSWWTLAESGGNAWTVPTGTTVDGGGFLVFARDTLAFTSVYSNAGPVIGGWTFGLNNGGESVYLLDDAGFPVDSVAYEDSSPWPESADGAGSTLELTDPDADNAVPASWRASSVRGGTPGRLNSVAVSTVADQPVPTGLVLGPPYPNPVRNRTLIAFATPVSGRVAIRVFDVLGRRVATLQDAVLGVGYHVAEWDVRGHPSGLYVVRLTGPQGQVLSTSVIVAG